MAFNYQAALDAGHSEDDVISYLTATRSKKFNVQAATKSGNSKQDIIKYLAATNQSDSVVVPPPATQSQPEPEPEPEKNAFQKTEEWLNTPAYQASDIAKSGIVGGAAKGFGNALKSTAAMATGLVTAPFKGLLGIPQIGKEAQELVKESGGLVPAIKNYATSLPGFAYDNLIPEAGKKLIEGKPDEAIGSLAENPAQVAPFLIGGVKGVNSKIPLLKKPLQRYGSAIDTTISGPKTVLNTGVKGLGSIVKKTGELMTSEPVKTFVSKGAPWEKIINPTTAQKMADLDSTIKVGVDKGIKPTVIGKPSQATMDKFYNNANVAVKTIAENRSKIQILDENGEQVAYPRSSAEAAQGISQAKKLIYKEYSEMSKTSGDMGAKYNPDPVLRNLDRAAKDLKNTPEVREYAESMKAQIEELRGQSPEVVEGRIEQYNSAWSSFYDGRVTKAKAQVDLSLAKALREGQDAMIEGTAGEGYQTLRNQYGSLKAIEKEVNKRALVNARKNGKSLTDFTDVFTGGELASGILSGNPALLLKAAAGKGIAVWYKSLNNPDRYIANMFKKAYETIPEPTTSTIYPAGWQQGGQGGAKLPSLPPMPSKTLPAAPVQQLPNAPLKLPMGKTKALPAAPFKTLKVHPSDAKSINLPSKGVLEGQAKLRESTYKPNPFHSRKTVKISNNGGLTKNKKTTSKKTAN